MDVEKKHDLSELNILDITKDYLNGNISFEEYYALELQWYDRFTRPKLPASPEKMPRESEGVINVGKNSR